MGSEKELNGDMEEQNKMNDASLPLIGALDFSFQNFQI
jgi:hypothetical protein